MPRFHFNIDDGQFVADEEGLELPDLAVARRVAVEGARSLLAEQVSRGAIDLRGRIEVVDERGEMLLVVRFADVVSITA